MIEAPQLEAPLESDVLEATAVQFIAPQRSPLELRAPAQFDAQRPHGNEIDGEAVFMERIARTRVRDNPARHGTSLRVLRRLLHARAQPAHDEHVLSEESEIIERLPHLVLCRLVETADRFLVLK